MRPFPVGDSSGAEVTCRVCRKTWPSDHSICPDDGSWLYEQTMVEILPRSRRASLDGRPVPMVRAASEGFGDTTVRTVMVDEISTTRAQRYESPAHAMPIRGASTDVIAAQLAPAESPVEIVAGTQIGEYEVEEKVGEGAMGTVYRAVQPQIGKHVAIKVMTPKVFGEAESVRRFVGEARAVAAIEHPGIVDVFGFGRLGDGRTYLVMEWLDGESLSARMQRAPLDYTDACEIIRQIARALDAAHGKGIIHRDLKPENVFLKKVVDDRPTVKLLDFGLAKSTNKDELANVAKTRSGQMLGTPLYMSPEQCKNKGVDHRTDIYALGCICFELLCGRTPYEADNVAEIITAHIVGEPPWPSQFNPDIAPELDRLLHAMIQKVPDHRPPLAEVRRVMGMELSRVAGFADIASSPFATPFPYGGTSTGTMRPATMPGALTTGTMRPVAQTPPAALPHVQAQYPTLAPNRTPVTSGPPWYFFAAIAVLLVVVAALLIVK